MNIAKFLGDIVVLAGWGATNKTCVKYHNDDPNSFCEEGETVGEKDRRYENPKQAIMKVVPGRVCNYKGYDPEQSFCIASAGQDNGFCSGQIQRYFDTSDILKIFERMMVEGNWQRIVEVRASLVNVNGQMNEVYFFLPQRGAIDSR